MTPTEAKDSILRTSQPFDLCITDTCEVVECRVLGEGPTIDRLPTFLVQPLKTPEVKYFILQAHLVQPFLRAIEYRKKHNLIYRAPVAVALTQRDLHSSLFDTTVEIGRPIGPSLERVMSDPPKTGTINADPELLKRVQTAGPLRPGEIDWSQNAPIVEEAGGGNGSYLPARFDLLPPDALCRLSEVFHRGEVKYGKGNWHPTEAWVHLNHALGHVFAFLSEDTSERSLEEHAYHVGCRVLMWIQRLEWDKKQRTQEG